MIKIFFLFFFAVPSVIISTSFLINWWISESVNKIEGFLIAPWITNWIWKLLLHFYIHIRSDKTEKFSFFQFPQTNFLSTISRPLASNQIELKLNWMIFSVILFYAFQFTFSPSQSCRFLLLHHHHHFVICNVVLLIFIFNSFYVSSTLFDDQNEVFTCYCCMYIFGILRLKSLWLIKFRNEEIFIL